MSLLTPELQSLVGRSATYHAPDEIGRAAIRYFAIAIGDTNPLYTDAEYARANGHEDVIAPPTYVVESNQYMTGLPDAEGYIGHSWGIEVPDTRTIRGGHEYEFFRHVYPTDRLTVHWKITDVSEKEMRDGRAMLLVDSEARYENQDGELLAINRETLIIQSL